MTEVASSTWTTGFDAVYLVADTDVFLSAFNGSRQRALLLNVGGRAG